MIKNLNSLVSDLDREIDYARTVSPLYFDVFSILRALLKSDMENIDMSMEGTLFKRVADLWQDREFSAWFERPLLLAAALHRTVRNHRDSSLAQFYPTCGGQYDSAQKDKLHEELKQFLAEHIDEFISRLKQQSLQTNEISRGIALLTCLIPIWEKKKSNVVLFEIGCSAGLNLLADRYGWKLLIDGSPIQISGEPALSININSEDRQGIDTHFENIPNLTESIKRRIGCDLSVPDLRCEDAQEMLEAMVWGDDVPRLNRLQAAMNLRREYSDQLELIQGDGVACLGKSVEELAKGMQEGDIFCIFNTVVTCYFDEANYQALRASIHKAFSGPLKNQICIWIEHEPPRISEKLTDAEKSFGSLIRLSTLNSAGELITNVVAGTEMHPKKITLFKEI